MQHEEVSELLKVTQLIRKRSFILRLPRWLNGKEAPYQCRRHRRYRFNPWVRKIPWRREWQSTPIFLPGKFHGQRSMAGFRPWGQKESDTTEQLSTHMSIRLREQLSHAHHTHTHTHTFTYIHPDNCRPEGEVVHVSG